MAAPQHEHVDPVLTGISIEYWDAEFVAKALFPDAPTDEVSGLYPEYEKKTGFLVENDLLSADGEAVEDRFRVDWKGFSCVPHARKQSVSAISKKYDVMGGKVVIPREVLASKLCMSKLQRTYEHSAAQIATSPTTYPFGNRFPQNAGWTSETDVVPVIKQALNACWQRGNTLLIGYDVWDILTENESILDRIKGSQKGIITVDILKELFDVQNVVVGKSRYYNKTSKSYEYIWGDNIVCAYVADPGPEKQWFGTTHQVDGGIQMRKYRDEKKGGGSDVVEGIWYYDIKVPCAECGALISGAGASTPS